MNIASTSAASGRVDPGHGEVDVDEDPVPWRQLLVLEQAELDLPLDAEHVDEGDRFSALVEEFDDLRSSSSKKPAISRHTALPPDTCPSSSGG